MNVRIYKFSGKEKQWKFLESIKVDRKKKKSRKGGLYRI